MDNTERIIKENYYIEGLSKALCAVDDVSTELMLDLEQDLNDALMESDGLFAAIRVIAVEDDKPTGYDLFLMANEKGESFFPIFTHPDYLREYLASDDFEEDDAPFCMVRYEQMANMLQTFARDNHMKCPGIVLNCGREEEIVCPMDDIEEFINRYHKTHDNLTDDEREKRRVLWCLEDTENSKE